MHRYLIDAYFIKPVYKLLLKRPLTLDDLQYVDEQVYNSMLWIRDNNIDGILDLNFTVLEERFGITEEKGTDIIPIKTLIDAKKRFLYNF